MNATTLAKFKELVGLTLEEAKQKYPGFEFRARVIDGRSMMGTCDWRPNRVNVSIANGKIDSTAISMG